MDKIDYKELSAFIASDVITPFYEIRLSHLKEANMHSIFRKKNPYLFKAKNIETSGDLAKAILDAFLSSQEETIFGRLMENLAIHVCNEVFNGYKPEEGDFRSVDLIFERNKKLYIVGIKSGTNWGNSDQINAMKRNFKIAKEILRVEHENKEIIAVNGCIYGKDSKPYKENKDSDLSYYKLCGQEFWELISSDDQFYKKIIQPLDKEAKKQDDIFKDLYVKKINEMTKDIVDLFYIEDNLDWDKIIDYISKSKS